MPPADQLAEGKGTGKGTSASGRGGRTHRDRPSYGKPASRAFWESLADHEFFGDRVQHLYFYGDVDVESASTLRDSVLLACRDSTVKNADGVFVAPKPIVLHVQSYGGSVFAEQWLLSVFNRVSVPLCVLVEVSASAATSLSVMAPYRVGTPWSISLLHEYSGSTGYQRRESLLASMDANERRCRESEVLYAARTRLRGEALRELLRRDLWLPADECLRLGVYDRVIRPDRGALVRKYLAENPVVGRAPFLRRNWNELAAGCTVAEVRVFDALLAAGGDARPVVFLAPGAPSCDDRRSAALAAIARILASPVPVYGIVDNAVTWWQLLPVLFCHRRYIYENAYLSSLETYTTSAGGRLRDIVANTETFRALIRTALRERARLPPGVIDGLFQRDEYFDAAACVRMGLCDEVVPLVAAGTIPKSFQGERL